MCLAIPGRVVMVRGDEGLIDFGGTRRWANLSLVEAKEGTYVVVHAGFAIQTLEEKDAIETLRLWSEMLSAMESPADARNDRGQR
ncbi:MAG: HypC/HybG/HupF family hydrogenase formation chaperone [Candidatus Thermoplasmatota archaeon]